MVHYTCDLCGKDLTSPREQRLVLKIESYPGFDPTELAEGDLDDDHMEAVSQLLQRDGGASSEDVEASLRTSLRYDLCPGCHSKFLKDPLGKEFLRTFDFSKN